MILEEEKFCSLQVGQLIVYYTPKKVITFAFFLLTRPSKAGKESFLRQVLLSDLWVETNKNIFNF